MTQIVSWGVLFYAFPVLVGEITTDTGWSATAVTLAFSGGLIISAIVGVPVGRWLDHRGPRVVMTAGSSLAAATVPAIALAPTLLWFAVAWSIAGVAQALVLYKPAFAALTGWYTEHRVRALTTLTVVAGLSSTVFAPLTAALASNVGWRGTYLVLGIVLAVVTIPAHAIGLNRPWPGVTRLSGHALDSLAGAATAKAVMRSPSFICLAGAMALATFALFAATFFLVPMLTGRGMDIRTAAWALGLSGAGQLLGRFGYGTLARRTGPTLRAVLILTVGGFAIAATAVISAPAAAVFVVVTILGAARGAFTLLEATAVTDRWGSAGFGALYGVFSAPSTVAIAVGPAAGAWLAGRFGGEFPLFAMLAILMLAAALAINLDHAARRARDGRTSHS
ncbi:MAG: MFS transporter [Homoserinimonas sp.]